MFTTRQLQLRPGHQADAKWAEALAALGAVPEQLVRIRQVHGRTVHILGRHHASAASRTMPEADALATDLDGVVLAVQAADCVPLLMADGRSGAVAAVHAGWRGTAAGVARSTVEAMGRAFGSRPEDLVVAFGPSIGPCCYHVGPELIDAFRAGGATSRQIAQWFTKDPDGVLRLDLWAANATQLIDAGLKADHVHRPDLCTRTHAALFDSYRADGPNAGRMAALIRARSAPDTINPAVR